MPRVLIDYHHTDLAESLHLLFEKRLGMSVHVPHGLEWREAGYWQFGRGYPDAGLGVAKQFLLGAEVDDLQPHRKLRRTRLDEADGAWDVVVATVPDNYDGYRRFAQERGARFVVEVGNVNQWAPSDALILDSTGKYPGGVQFTPEFDMDGAFAYQRPSPPYDLVGSFVNLFPGLPCYPLYEQTMALLPEWGGHVFGHNGQRFVKPTIQLATLMRHLSFGWHDKVTGDGFGYVIHYWASVGRPLIGHASHYRGQVAEDLWEDGVTCIDLDRHAPDEVATLMQQIVKDRDRHEEMCFTIAQRVRERIDFAADADRLAQALGLLVAA